MYSNTNFYINSFRLSIQGILLIFLTIPAQNILNLEPPTIKECLETIVEQK